MPTIAIFYGIVVQMFHQDHAPPHIHVFHGGREAWVRIDDGEIIHGSLAPIARRLVRRWVFRYRSAPMENWDRGRRLEPFERIPGPDA